MEMNTGKQLLVDDRIVEDIWNVRRQVIRPAKCVDNPLMVADRPWYEGYYFDLLQIYYSATKATIDIQLAFSRDGKQWDRLPTRDVFLELGTPHGQGADFDSGMVIVSRPVLVGDELWFYYTGYKAVHTEFSKTYAVGLAVAKLDRLIGRRRRWASGDCF
jgi:hypothetical protein